MKHITWKRAIVGVLIILLVAFATAVIIWMQATKGPSEIALQALQSDNQVQVTQEREWILFEPVSVTASTGFIFYPGAGVDYRSYAPILKEIAAHNFSAVVVSMPLNLAFLNTQAADQVRAKYPEVDNWLIGGHSLGGVAAASYAANQPAIEGIALWAAYPGNDNLKDDDLSVVSIYGSEDGLTTPQDIDESRPLLPPTALFVDIEGGNHAQFGSYGPQNRDNPATISPEAQWRQIVEATVALLNTVSN